MLSFFASHDAGLRSSHGKMVDGKHKSPSLIGILVGTVFGDGGTFHVSLSCVKPDG